MKSFPFKSINGDRKYCADDFALHQKTLYTNGIIGNQDNNLQVFSSEGMKIELRPGFALIEGHTFVNSNSYIVDLDYAGNTFSRIDRLVLRLDHTERTIKPVLKKGEEASKPIPPGIETNADKYELALADITVNKGAISITQNMIRDLRHTNLCGIASFRGKPINVNDLYIQYESDIVNTLKEFKDYASMGMETFNEFVKNNEALIIDLINELDSVIESENSTGEIISKLYKKQDRHMKDRENPNKYELFFENGQLYYEEVE